MFRFASTGNPLKGQGHVMYTNFRRKNDFVVFLFSHITVIFYSFSQYESVILKI